MTTVAEHLVEALVSSGVRRVYGLAGDSLNTLSTPFTTTRRSNGLTSGTKKQPPLLRAVKRNIEVSIRK